MFLRCSYFSPNLSLDVLIDLVLIQNNACITQFQINACFTLWETRESDVSQHARNNARSYLHMRVFNQARDVFITRQQTGMISLYNTRV